MMIAGESSMELRGVAKHRGYMHHHARAYCDRPGGFARLAAQDLLTASQPARGGMRDGPCGVAHAVVRVRNHGKVIFPPKEVPQAPRK